MPRSELQEGDGRSLVRLECPVHGPNFGIVAPGRGRRDKLWCQHCRIPASELRKVTYVPLDVAENLTTLLAEIDTLLDGDDLQATIAGIERVVASYRAAYPREETT